MSAHVLNHHQMIGVLYHSSPSLLQDQTARGGMAMLALTVGGWSDCHGASTHGRASSAAHKWPHLSKDQRPGCCCRSWQSIDGVESRALRGCIEGIAAVGRCDRMKSWVQGRRHHGPAHMHASSSLGLYFQTPCTWHQAHACADMPCLIGARF